MKDIYGAKAKNDKINDFEIATLLRGGNIPKASAPKKKKRYGPERVTVGTSGVYTSRTKARPELPRHSMPYDGLSFSGWAAG